MFASEISIDENFILLVYLHVIKIESAKINFLHLVISPVTTSTTNLLSNDDFLLQYSKTLLGKLHACA